MVPIMSCWWWRPAERVRTCTGGRGVDRALDAVAGRASGRLFDCIEPNGELVCYGLLASDEIVLPAQRLIFAPFAYEGIHGCAHCVRYQQRSHKNYTPLKAVNLGSFKPRFWKRFPLKKFTMRSNIRKQQAGRKAPLLTPAYYAQHTAFKQMNNDREESG